MAWFIQFTEEGKKTLKNLHIDIQRRIKFMLKKIGKNEEIENSTQLTGQLDGFYSFHEGNYRAIYSIEGDVLTVHFVGHRRGVYREFSG